MAKELAKVLLAEEQGEDRFSELVRGASRECQSVLDPGCLISAADCMVWLRILLAIIVIAVGILGCYRFSRRYWTDAAQPKNHKEAAPPSRAKFTNVVRSVLSNVKSRLERDRRLLCSILDYIKHQRQDDGDCFLLYEELQTDPKLIQKIKNDLKSTASKEIAQEACGLFIDILLRHCSHRGLVAFAKALAYCRVKESDLAVEIVFSLIDEISMYHG